MAVIGSKATKSSAFLRVATCLPYLLWNWEKLGGLFARSAMTEAFDALPN